MMALLYKKKNTPYPFWVYASTSSTLFSTTFSYLIKIKVKTNAIFIEKNWRVETGRGSGRGMIFHLIVIKCNFT